MFENLIALTDDPLEDDSAVDFIVDEDGEPCISISDSSNGFYEADT